MMMKSDANSGGVEGGRQGDRYSLNSIYGNSIGFIQSMSLILNAGLMVYAHVGLSGVFLSNHERIDAATSGSSTSTAVVDNGEGDGGGGTCSAADIEFWETKGALLKPDHQTFCATGAPRCFISPDCTVDCFAETYGYTEACAACFGPLPACNLGAGCTSVCSGSTYVREDCEECTKDCDATFHACSGLPYVDVYNLTLPPESVGTTTDTGTESEASMAITNETETEEAEDSAAVSIADLRDEVIDSLGICKAQQLGVDYNDITEYQVVYELLFFDAIEEAWNGNARLLAFIILIFSGIWPYAKNVILMLAWYLPLTETRRSLILLWLRRLGKYTLVDVYVVIALMVGVMLQMTISAENVPVIIKGEPRFAIIAFLLATLWEFFHIEWMTHCHQEKLHLQPEQQQQTHGETTKILDTLRFKQQTTSNGGWVISSFACKSSGMLYGMVSMHLGLSIIMFTIGTASENIRFTSLWPEDDEGCVRSYNLYNLGTALVNDFSMHLNGAPGMVWILFLSYIMLLVVSPLFVHAVQAAVCLGNVKDKRLCLAADAIWTFASIDVYLLALFVSQYKFTEMMEAMAGNEGSEFFSINAELGPGFFILIAYSVLAGIFQWLFNCAVAQYYPTIDVLDRRIKIWPPGACDSCLLLAAAEPTGSTADGSLKKSGQVAKNTMIAEMETERPNSASNSNSEAVNAASSDADGEHPLKEQEMLEFEA